MFRASASHHHDVISSPDEAVRQPPSGVWTPLSDTWWRSARTVTPLWILVPVTQRQAVNSRLCPSCTTPGDPMPLQNVSDRMGDAVAEISECLAIRSST